MGSNKLEEKKWYFGDSSQRKLYHFYSFLAGSFALLLLAGIIVLLSCLFIKTPSISPFSRDNVLDFIGIFFSVTGTVTALYFIIMGVYTYRTQRKLDEVIERMEEATEKLWFSNQVTKRIQSFHYKVLYDFFSERIASDKSNADRYKLAQSRLACLSKAIDTDERANMIRLLGSIRRSILSQKEIENDINLLQSIIDDDSELDDIINAAKEARDNLIKLCQ